MSINNNVLDELSRAAMKKGVKKGDIVRANYRHTESGWILDAESVTVERDSSD